MFTFWKVKALLHEHRVQAFVLDFEAAVWGAIRSVFPTTGITARYNLQFRVVVPCSLCQFCLSMEVTV